MPSKLFGERKKIFSLLSACGEGHNLQSSNKANRSPLRQLPFSNFIMPRSGTNSQGNYYSTPGGSNSNSGSSYYCKSREKSSSRSSASGFGISKSHFRSLLFVWIELFQTPTAMAPTTTPMTTVPATTTAVREAAPTPLLLVAKPASNRDDGIIICR